MVKLSAVSILKYNGPDRDATSLGFAAELSSWGFFQRGTIREMMMFVARTVARKTQVGRGGLLDQPAALPQVQCVDQGHAPLPLLQIGQRQTVQQEDYYCHVFNNDGLVGVAFVDADYPARAGFSVVNKVRQ